MTYVITYTEIQNHSVIWKTKGDAKQALVEFWKTFDDTDAKNVSNVRIFELIAIDIDATRPTVTA